ncbi:hypothetical protein BCAR13_410061 [Paraburkholderia caribensis]|nr:hypothetical protein BCAR13_410061 [Paraburkholderia caribensis]
MNIPHESAPLCARPPKYEPIQSGRSAGRSRHLARPIACRQRACTCELCRLKAFRRTPGTRRAANKINATPATANIDVKYI